MDPPMGPDRTRTGEDGARIKVVVHVVDGILLRLRALNYRLTYRQKVEHYPPLKRCEKLAGWYTICHIL